MTDSAADPPQTGEWVPATPDYRWSFPRDHWSHPGYKTEWWYFTGILTAVDDTTQQFGYQFTFFRVGLTPDVPVIESAWAVSDLIMGHAAVTDLTSGHHVFSELLHRTTPFLGRFGDPEDSLIAWSRGPAGTDDRWTLSWNGSGFDFTARDDQQKVAVSLATRSRKPLTLQGPNGYSRKGPGPTAASLYYSFTRLATEGTVTIGGRTFRVTGESWMDKEFGSNQLSPEQQGWDWLRLRLNDGRDLMLYVLRSRDGARYGRATLVASDGSPRYLAEDDWTLHATGRWRSAATGAEYPLAWTVELPGEGLSLEIRPLWDNQENVARLVPGLHYWEGAVEVRNAEGRSVGLGYVELTGYGTRSRPAI
jgi:predicted secreted hydrolase